MVPVGKGHVHKPGSWADYLFSYRPGFPIAMINTNDSPLGHSAKGWPDPYERHYWAGFAEDPQETICHDPSLLVYRDVAFTAFQPKAEPDLLYEVAEGIVLVYIQAEAWCFEPDAGKLMEYRFHI